MTHVNRFSARKIALRCDNSPRGGRAVAGQLARCRVHWADDLEFALQTTH
jgi:hypothetical protein